MYKVNKQKCLGIDNCGLCQQNCPGATEKDEDGKAKIVDQEKLEQCGGESVCPMGAIEKAEGQEQPRRGRGLGRGKGRGLGKGPRDGRGKGRGGGGRR